MDVALPFRRLHHPPATGARPTREPRRYLRQEPGIAIHDQPALVSRKAIHQVANVRPCGAQMESRERRLRKESLHSHAARATRIAWPPNRRLRGAPATRRGNHPWPIDSSAAAIFAIVVSQPGSSGRRRRAPVSFTKRSVINHVRECIREGGHITGGCWRNRRRCQRGRDGACQCAHDRESARAIASATAIP